MVVSQRLAGGGRVGRRSARSGEVAELSRSLCRLILNILSDGAWKGEPSGQYSKNAPQIRHAWQEVEYIPLAS